MKIKRMISFSIASVLLCSCICGCGEDDKSSSDIVNKDSQNSFSNDNNAMENSDNATSESRLMHIDDARKYSSGVAWVKSEDKWNIVDTNGTVKNSFPENYTILTDFEGGFSIIDPNATVYMSGAITLSDQVIIIDTNGNIVLDFQASGYSGIINYNGLAEGSVILKKNIDTLEKSGDFLFHYDLNNGVEKEICSFREKNDLNDLKYISDGFYIRRLDSDYTGTSSLSNEVLCFHNYLTDQTISFRDNQVIKSVFGDNFEYDEWSVDKTGNFILASVEIEGYSGVTKSFVLDLENKSCESVPMNDFDDDNETYFNGNYRNLALIAGYYPKPKEYLYDLDTKKYTQFSPNCDYECEIIDYYNGNFLVKTEKENEENENVFYVLYTVIDWNMNPLFTLKQYKYTTTLLDDYLISDEDDGSVSIIQVPSMSIVKSIDNSTVIYVDETNKYVWVNSNQEITECYNIETGELLFSIDSIYKIHSDFNDGLALIENSTTGELIYVDINGEQLKIVDNSI